MAVLTAIDVAQAPEEPLAVGHDLATAYDEPLLLLYVMPEAEYQNRRESREELPEELRGDGLTIEHARDVAAELALDCLDAHLDSPDRARVEALGRVGSPAEEIIATAEARDPRYVVLGGRKRSPVTQALFGSVSQSVMRETTQPVVTLMEAET